MAAVLRSGQLAQGQAVASLETAFAAFVGAPFCVATSSGTAALHLALLAHGVGPGDEVITTPFSFIATANAILYTGATPVFADIDPDTLNVAPDSVERAITPRTRAILPVDLYGNPCDLVAFEDIAHRRGLALIDDACQAHGADIGGRRTGSFGTGCFSFYPTKNMTSGEGGMIATSDPDVAERAAMLRSHGSTDRYVHEELGYNYRMSEVHAAIGLAQLQRLEERNAARSANAAHYDAELGLPRPAVLPNAHPAWHQYTLLLERGRRNAVAVRLEQVGVGVGIYYPTPIHHQPLYRRLGFTASCPNAEAAAERVLSIPVHPGLNSEDRHYVVEQVKSALSGWR